MELAPGLHRIGNDIVAAYLVVAPRGITVIDAGLPGHWRDLIRELSAMGRSVADVRGVVLTHGDSDHVGFAERLRREHRVPVYVHAGDAERAMGGPKPKNAKEPMRLGAVLRFAAYALSKGGMRTRWLAEVVRVGGDEVLDLPGSPRIIPLPGHSPGSIAIHVPDVDALFVGDALTTRNVLTGGQGPQPAPFTDEPAQAIASLDAVRDVEATWVLPGHGAPWHGGVASALAQIDPARDS